MSNLHSLGEALKGGAEIVQELTPLRARKSPVIAFGTGLVFGALGIALYFRSAKDFFICMGMFIGLSILIPVAGSILGWFFASFYGAWRAHTSNGNAGW